MKKSIVLLIVSLIVNINSLYAEDDSKKLTSYFNQKWLKALISIEVYKVDPKTKEPKFIPIGTGFLIESKGHRLILATAKHVIIDRDTGKLHKNLCYRLNTKTGSSTVVTDKRADEVAKGGWFFSKKNDVACRYMVFFKEKSDIALIPLDAFLNKENVQAGAPILFPGFPMRLRSEDYAIPIVRHGIVALVDDENYLIDALVFPGNSGSPVLYSPAIKFGSTIKSGVLNIEKVIGLVSQSISYVEKAIGEQSRRARITFEDNSGLCQIVPADAILALLQRDDFVALDNPVKE